MKPLIILSYYFKFSRTSLDLVVGHSETEIWNWKSKTTQMICSDSTIESRTNSSIKEMSNLKSQAYCMRSSLLYATRSFLKQLLYVHIYFPQISMSYVWSSSKLAFSLTPIFLQKNENKHKLKAMDHSKTIYIW